jgi:hypothetical protein
VDNPLDSLPPPPKANRNPLDALPPPGPLSTGDIARRVAGAGLKTALESTPIPATAGLAENALSGITSGVGSLADVIHGSEPGAHDYTYRPRTEAGKALAEGQAAAAHAASPVIDAALRSDAKDFGLDPEAFSTTVRERVPEALGAVSTIAPLAGGAAKFAGPAVRGVTRGVSNVGAAEATAAARAAGPAQSALEEVQRNGYQVLPSSVPARNPSVKPGDVPGSFKETLTSSPQQTEQVIRNNAVTSTGHIGSDFGTPNATKLLPQHYAAAKVAPGKFYDAAGSAIDVVGKNAPMLPETRGILKKALADNSPDAPNVMVKQQLERIDKGLESGDYKGPQIVKDISFLREQNNPTARFVADQLENEMGNQLQNQPKVLGDFRNARTEFAKIFDAQDATIGGQIDAATYARLARRRPDLLTGGAAKVAQAGDEIPHLTRLPSPTANKSPVGSTILGTARNLIAPQIAKLPGMNLLDPRLQQRIGQSAPPPGPLASPTRIIGPPGLKPTGGIQPPLGVALSPSTAPPMATLRPAPRAMPQATSPLNVSPQVADMFALRDEALPGRAVGDRGPMTATRGAGEVGLTAGRAGRAHLHEEGAVPARVRELLQALMEARRRGQ